MGSVRTYRVRWDGTDWFVEAKSFGCAIDFWREWMRQNRDIIYGIDPEEVAHVCDEPVITEERLVSPPPGEAAP